MSTVQWENVPASAREALSAYYGESIEQMQSVEDLDWLILQIKDLPATRADIFPMGKDQTVQAISDLAETIRVMGPLMERRARRAAEKDRPGIRR